MSLASSSYTSRVLRRALAMRLRHRPGSGTPKRMNASSTSSSSEADGSSFRPAASDACTIAILSSRSCVRRDSRSWRTTRLSQTRPGPSNSNPRSLPSASYTMPLSTSYGSTHDSARSTESNTIRSLDSHTKIGARISRRLERGAPGGGRASVEPLPVLAEESIVVTSPSCACCADCFAAETQAPSRVAS